MAEIRDVRIPDIGNFDEVSVLDVLVQPGAVVKAEDPLVTLESDKASMDVPAPFAGTLKDVLVKAGDKVKKEALLVRVEVAGEANAPAPKPQASSPLPAGEGPGGEGRARGDLPKGDAAARPAPEPGETRRRAADQPAAALTPQPLSTPYSGAHSHRERGDNLEGGGTVFEGPFDAAYASPSVRRFARELGADLNRIKGSGRSGRIVKEDVEAFVKQALQRAAPAAGGAFSLPEMPAIDFSKFGAISRRELGRIKKLTGANTQRAWITIPHVTQFDLADITELEAFRKEQGAAAQAKGVKLTLLAFLLKACAYAVREHPDFCASLEPGGEAFILKQYCHIGIAVDTPEGLVVPVIRDVDRKGILALAEELGAVSERARTKKLKMDDLQGGCFTISSLGGIGGTAFTPIVNAPEVAILGVSRSSMQPVWKNGLFQARLMLPLSLSYDHRVIDGAQAARFTTFLAGILSDVRLLSL